MNREDIIRMGRQAGALIEVAQEKDLQWLERFAAIVAAEAVEEEREECAKLCDYLWESKASEAYECATAIRKRVNYE